MLNEYIYSKLRNNFPKAEQQQAVVNWMCKLAKTDSYNVPFLTFFPRG